MASRAGIFNSGLELRLRNLNTLLPKFHVCGKEGKQKDKNQKKVEIAETFRGKFLAKSCNILREKFKRFDGVSTKLKSIDSSWRALHFGWTDISKATNNS